DSSSAMSEPRLRPEQTNPPPTYTVGEVASAWVPWVLLTLFVFAWGIPEVKTALGVPSKEERSAFLASDDQALVKPTYVGIKMPGLHKQMTRVPPVVPKPETEPAVYDFGWLAGTGSGIFLAALVSAVWLRIPPVQVLRIFLHTCYKMRWPLFTIACMLAI